MNQNTSLYIVAIKKHSTLILVLIFTQLILFYSDFKSSNDKENAIKLYANIEVDSLLKSDINSINGFLELELINSKERFFIQLSDDQCKFKESFPGGNRVLEYSESNSCELNLRTEISVESVLGKALYGKLCLDKKFNRIYSIAGISLCYKDDKQVDKLLFSVKKGYLPQDISLNIESHSRSTFRDVDNEIPIGSLVNFFSYWNEKLKGNDFSIYELRPFPSSSDSSYKSFESLVSNYSTSCKSIDRLGCIHEQMRSVVANNANQYKLPFIDLTVNLMLFNWFITILIVILHFAAISSLKIVNQFSRSGLEEPWYLTDYKGFLSRFNWTLHRYVFSFCIIVSIAISNVFVFQDEMLLLSLFIWNKDTAFYGGYIFIAMNIMLMALMSLKVSQSLVIELDALRERRNKELHNIDIPKVKHFNVKKFINLVFTRVCVAIKQRSIKTLQ